MPVENEPGVPSHQDVPRPQAAEPGPVHDRSPEQSSGAGSNPNPQSPQAQPGQSLGPDQSRQRFRRPPPRRRFGRDRRGPGGGAGGAPGGGRDRMPDRDRGGARYAPGQTPQGGQPNSSTTYTEAPVLPREGDPDQPSGEPNVETFAVGPDGSPIPNQQRSSDDRNQPAEGERASRPSQSSQEQRVSRERARHMSHLYAAARSQVDRVRRDLEGVLKELERVQGMLLQAEQDQELTENELENLKDALHNLHRGQVKALGGQPSRPSEEHQDPPNHD